MAENSLLSRLDGIKLKYEEIGQQMTDPQIIANGKRFAQLGREYRELEPLVAASDKYRTLWNHLTEAKDILATEKDEEMREMAKIEIDEIEPKLAELEDEIKILLIPADPQDAKNAILEIRAGTGGDEAAIFAGDLFRMYQKYIEKRGWKYEINNESPGTSGGYKEIVVKVTGNGVYGVMKYESGVHRVQRVPQTETQGRVHTSAVTVAVLPEAEDTEIEIRPEDVRVDVMRAGGCGGQCVNTTDSAVRLTHIPTGLVVIQQDEKSQLRNKEKAFRVLRARLFDLEESKKNAERAAARKSMVGSGDRSERIRTYNFPQNRITDHRINLTLYKLDQFMQGYVDEMVDALCIYAKEEQLKESGN
jgi:peptide chain release factor 1